MVFARFLSPPMCRKFFLVGGFESLSRSNASFFEQHDRMFCIFYSTQKISSTVGWISSSTFLHSITFGRRLTIDHGGQCLGTRAWLGKQCWFVDVATNQALRDFRFQFDYFVYWWTGELFFDLSKNCVLILGHEYSLTSNIDRNVSPNQDPSAISKT